MTVYVTRGRKYHADKTCRLMTAGEDLWDFDGEDWSWIAGSFRRTVDSPEYAAACGKLPCLACVPAAERAFPPLYGQTFGHEPIDEYTGTVEGDLGVTHLACQRCMQWTNWADFQIGRRVPWPCTTAVILGLAPRPAAA